MHSIYQKKKRREKIGYYIEKIFGVVRGCSASDWVMWNAQATNVSNHEKVNVIVCSGLIFRGTIIRFK